MIPFDPDNPPPIRVVTRLLAEMQTGIASAGIRALDGGLERFVIFTLIVRQSLSQPSPAELRPISVYSLAGSLSQPYETVRRHVNALIEAGLCERHASGVAATSQGLRQPVFAALLIETHDRFVRFVEDMAALGVPMPQPREGGRYDLRTGVQAAADTMLAVVDTNRGTHGDLLELVIFSTILCANVRGFARDAEIAKRYADEREKVPDALISPVRISVVGRTIGLSDTTIRRRVEMLLADGRLEQHRAGLVVSQDWLNLPASVETSRQSYRNIRRLLERVTAAGFAIDAPASAYVTGRPPDIPFA